MSEDNSEINALLTNPEFVRWVRDPDKELELFWQEWMQGHPDRIQTILLAREIVLGLEFRAEIPRSDVKQSLLAKILNEENKEVDDSFLTTVSPAAKTYRSSWSKISRFYKVAAILLVTLALALASTLIVTKNTSPLPVSERRTVTKATEYGEKLNFKLPDGSVVWLNSGSELQFPETFDTLERVVYLKGEGFFEVEKSDQPFTVVANGLATTALGTSFNIKDGEDDALRISLLTGKVKVENTVTHENVLLLPGQQLTYSLESKKTLIGLFDESQVVGWKSGLLQFTNASFEEVSKELEKWYGVSIKVIGRPSRKWKLTGSYSNQNLDMVLDRISYIEHFNFSIQDKSVEIKF
ncbi:MAG TPA: FecR domain-containing protein [Cyclobacteriaceae bacterium]|nr:FecR domain-containing protein [Cyclobacteriaceae bacterium]